jgi:hypothetical protein
VNTKDEPIWSALLEAHDGEAERHGVGFTNHGQYTGEDVIESKTDKARLSSYIDRDTGEVSHEWWPYDYHPLPDNSFGRQVARELEDTNNVETANKRRREFAAESGRFVQSIQPMHPDALQVREAVTIAFETLGEKGYFAEPNFWCCMSCRRYSRRER